MHTFFSIGRRAGWLALAAGLAGFGARAQTAPPLAASSTVTVAVPPALATDVFATPRTVQVPAGWALAVYARVPGARFMALTPEGNLLVSNPGAGKIYLVRPGTSGAVPTVSEFATGLKLPHDMVFHTIGSTTYLYLAESNQVSRCVYQAGSLTASTKQVVVSGLPDASTPELNGAYSHALKNIALDSNHKLYVSIASTCNVCLSDTQSDPRRAAIYQYDADGSNRVLFAQGLRNAEGLAFIPGTNVLWVTVNGRDQTPYPTQDQTGQYGQVIASYVDNHPPDSFTKVVQGAHYGWPFANPNPDGGVDNMPFDLDYDMNRTGTVPLATFTSISKGIQAHSAALGFCFLQGTAFPAAYASGATVALHGSWNRSTPTGYKVIYFPWNAATQTPGLQADLVTGFVSAQSGNAWGRPVDTAVDTQGALLISDDQSGTIYKLTAPASLLAARPGTGASLARLYPNPTGTGTTTLDLSAVPAGPYQATVLDVLGRPVLPAVRLSGGAPGQLPLVSLAAGTYLVRVQGEQYYQVLRLTVE